MSAKMSLHQRDLLKQLAYSDVGDITNECVMKALARRGYAERYVERWGHINGRRRWRITQAGREAVAGLN